MTESIRKTLFRSGPALVLALCSTANADVIIDEYPDNFGGTITCLGAGNDATSLGLGPAACDGSRWIHHDAIWG